MTPSRRALLMSMVSAALSLNTKFAIARTDIASDNLNRHGITLAAFADTLLPDDGKTPAASTLGVDIELLEFISESEPFTRMTHLVCDWLDTIGDQPFAELNPQERLHIVDYMSAAERDVLEGRFYHLVRLLAIEFYYSRPEALAGLDLAVAPQPVGYLPPWS